MAEDRPMSTIRRMLEEGEADPRLIAKAVLLEKLFAAAAKKDGTAIVEAARKLKANENEMAAAGQKLRAAMVAAFEKAKAVTDPDARTAELVAAFEFTAKAQYEAFDVLGDEETGNAAIAQSHAISKALDAIPPGRRAALAALLDSPDDGVLVKAAVHLKKLMPERVDPILREIDERQGGSSIGFTAMWALPPKGMSEPPKTKDAGDDKP